MEETRESNSSTEVEMDILQMHEQSVAFERQVEFDRIMNELQHVANFWRENDRIRDLVDSWNPSRDLLVLVSNETEHSPGFSVSFASYTAPYQHLPSWFLVRPEDPVQVQLDAAEEEEEDPCDVTDWVEETPAYTPVAETPENKATVRVHAQEYTY